MAVVPTRAELWLLEQALRPPTSAVDAGVAGLLVVGSEAVGFRHELLRQAVEGSLSTLGRQELNRRVMEVLAGASERQVDVARLVHHAREAGDVEAVLRYAPEAARTAAAAAHREAVEHYRAVLPHAERLPTAVHAELLEGYSVECYLSGLSSEAVSARQAAVDLRESAGDQEKVGESLRWLSRLHWWDGSRREAEAAAARAIAVLEPLPPGHQLAMAYSNQAQLDMLANRTEAAMGWAGRAELEEAFQVAVAAGLEDHAARAVGNLATIAAEMRDYGHARQDLDRALAFAQAHELAGWVQHVLGHRARVRLDQGDWAGAEQDARAALAERTQGGGRAGAAGAAPGAPRRPPCRGHAPGGHRARLRHQ